MIRHDEIIVDLFAGGGGASQGIFQATGRHPDLAVNHDPIAIAVHARNHPETEHRCESIWKVEPVEACAGRPVGLLWASPDCRHFSRASGGRPKWKSVRSLPGVVLTWAKRVRPRKIFVENVREMLGWGPLLDDGTPCPKRIGRSFNTWVGRLRGLGYRVEWRELCAADFGAPTVRTRLVIVASQEGPVIWPHPSHSKAPSMFEKQWRSAGECIDWSIPGKSIFGRERPLAEATLRRIAEGMMRYVINANDPYIVPATLISVGYGEREGQAPRVPGLDKPLGTIVAGGRKHALVQPFLAGCGGRAAQSPPRSTDAPFGTITTKADQILVMPHISELYGTATGRSITQPLSSVTAQGGHQAPVSGFLAPITHQGKNRGSSLHASVPTITCAHRGEHALVSAYVAQHNGGAVGRAAADPLSTITTQATQQQLIEATLSDDDLAGAERVAAFLIKYYGSGTAQHQSVALPLHTATTLARFAVVMVHGTPRVITDITMRMLAVPELAKAQGFHAGYDLTNNGTVNKTGQVRLIGNSVSPDMAEAVVRSNYGYSEQERAAA